MDNELIKNNSELNSIFDNIKDLIINSRNNIYNTVNIEMLHLYWNIGRIIMEIQQGNERAGCGDAVVDKLSQRLTNEFGRGFSKRNLERMRKFYICFNIQKYLVLFHICTCVSHSYSNDFQPLFFHYNLDLCTQNSVLYHHTYTLYQKCVRVLMV